MTSGFTNTNSFSPSSGARKSESKVLPIQFQVPDVFLFGPFLDVREEEGSGLFLLRPLAPSSEPGLRPLPAGSPPKDPAPNTVTLAIRAPAHELRGGETNLQPVTHARAGA